MIGVGTNFVGLDPVKALFWAAVINGVVAVPIMVLLMHLSSHEAAMGKFTLPPFLKIVGWIATVTMALAAVAMFATMVMGAH